jgi:hypothetical protein
MSRILAQSVAADLCGRLLSRLLLLILLPFILILSVLPQRSAKPASLAAVPAEQGGTRTGIRSGSGA